MDPILNSSYLDFTAYQLISANTTTVKAAYHLGDADIHVATNAQTVNVALVLDRASDPTDLLSADWAVRQTGLAELNSTGNLWTVYGADETDFATVYSYLEANNYTILGNHPESTGDYVTSQDSRTIWVELDATEFAALFGTPLMVAGADVNKYDFLYWDGNLSLPTEISSLVQGLWVDGGGAPEAENLAGDVSVTLTEGPQSEGNSTTAGYDATSFTPNVIASDLYNFPLDGTQVETGTLALIEPGMGSGLPNLNSGTFNDLLKAYLQSIGIELSDAEYAQAYTQGAAGQYQDATYIQNGGGAGERSMDVGIAAAINPRSDLALYVGSGNNGAAGATIFTAYQSAIWKAATGLSSTASVISSSWGDPQNSSPNSPFYWAYSQLFVDAALNNQTVVTALGDGGSSNSAANGLDNVEYNYASAYSVLVGGSSLSTTAAADLDTTLASLVKSAGEGNLSTIWQLVSGGLKSAPSNAAAMDVFIETVWNQYGLEADGTISYSYQGNNSGSGGVDTTQTIPSYQLDYGLTPTTSDTGETGRGLPDVTANAGGNTWYVTPPGDMVSTTTGGGTSASAPLWGSLFIQLNAIFEDQGLPALGYSTDLLYLASAIAPASFNDITLGNNISSYYKDETSPYVSGGEHVTPTGYGYTASEGYDLASGLGSPNGLLLARAMTAIAHAQMYSEAPAVLLEADSGGGTGAWTSSVDQSLLFQSALASAADWSLSLGTSTTSFSGTASGAYAWTATLAQQSLQSDFDSALVTMFDGQSQGQLYQANVGAGAAVGVTIGGATAGSTQADLTADFGFVDFATDGDASVTVARPVAVAQTAGGLDDQDVIVRLRQNGMNDISVLFYEVDDYSGLIDGIAPGETGYAEAASARAYQTDTGAVSISGAGYGAYSTTEIVGVDANDLIAMKITSGGQSYWAFAQANEQVNGADVAHLWSYGLNTWGWEDLYGGGDQDYNDLIVQLDFTSDSGSGWIA